jgi:hypothetical protein
MCLRRTVRVSATRPATVIRKLDRRLRKGRLVTPPAITEELARFVLPPLQFDGVCIEARDAATVAAFWGVVLGGTVHDLGDGWFRVDPAPGRPGREIVRVNTVPTSRPEGARVHFDVRLPGAEPDQLLAAGARLVRRPGDDPWYVLADPEGNEFCAYPAVDDRPPGIFQFVVKCRDAHALAGWWADVLGGEVDIEGEAAAVIGAPEFPWDFMVFDPVPESKIGKNRMHWHVDLRDPEPTDLLAAGATVLREPGAGIRWWILADPEGNEFCAAP